MHRVSNDWKTAMQQQFAPPQHIEISFTAPILQNGELFGDEFTPSIDLSHSFIVPETITAIIDSYDGVVTVTDRNIGDGIGKFEYNGENYFYIDYISGHIYADGLNSSSAMRSALYSYGGDITLRDSHIIKYASDNVFSLGSFEIPKQDISFSFDDRKGDFNLLKPSSIAKQGLLKKKIRVRYGIESGATTPGLDSTIEDGIEWIIAGYWYIDSIKSSSNDITAEITAKNLFCFLESKFDPSYIATVPKGYSQFDGLGSDGTKSLDLGFRADENTSFVIDFTPHNTIGTSGYGTIFGARDSSLMSEFHITTYTTGGKFRYGSSEVTLNLVKDKRTQVSYDSTKSTNNVVSVVDGVTNTHTLSKSGSPTTRFLSLYALNENGSFIQNGTMDFYSLRVYDGSIDRENLTHIFLPCINNSNGSEGVYDIIEDTYIPFDNNVGTTTGGYHVTTLEDVYNEAFSQMPNYLSSAYVLNDSAIKYTQGQVYYYNTRIYESFNHTIGETLQLLANATGSLIWQTKDGMLRIGYTAWGTVDNTYIIEPFNSYSYPEAELKPIIPNISINDMFYYRYTAGEEQSIRNEVIFEKAEADKVHVSFGAYYGGTTSDYDNFEFSGDFRCDVRLETGDRIKLEGKYNNFTSVIVREFHITYDGSFNGSYKIRVIQ